MPGVSRPFRHACALALGGLLLALVPLVGTPQPPADAIGSGYLCTGYSACQKAGYGHAGYANNNQKMYWRMYKGHNCTNYVAYRMVKAGMPNVRPWSGGGNATYWGQKMAHITDQQPRVGAVAWWRANVPGAGSSGHVAYVERVISPTEIVISEDSWGGDFHWRKLVKGTGWPTGFIHFVDKNIENLEPPTVSGTPQVGVPLTATPGSWKPTAATVAFQWLVGGTPVPGATQATYTPTAADRGKKVSVTVVASHPKFSPSTVTLPTSGPVAWGQLVPVEPPQVTGDPYVEETLTATPGSWSPQPAAQEIRWRADNVTIEGATGPTLTVTRELVGKDITAVSVAQLDGYKKAVKKSAKVGPIFLGTISTTPFGAKGRNRVGSKMWIAPGTVTPADATVDYVWLRDGEVVAGATTNSYVATAADAGARMTAMVVLRKQHYETKVLNFNLGRVTTKPTLTVKAVGRKRSAVVVVKVTASGVTNPGGKVTVRVGKKTVTARPSGGRARVRLDGVPPGSQKVWVSYAGTPVVEAAKKTANVRVLR